MSNDKKDPKSIRQRNYLARDFDGFRNVLLNYARQYYPDRIQDFSEASMGGLFLDMAAYIGDNMSFYLDHLYGELNYETVVETENIEKILRTSNIKITGATPSFVTVDFYIEVPVSESDNSKPSSYLLPTIKADSIVSSDSGVTFMLFEDVNFWEIDEETKQTKVAKDVIVKNGRKINDKIVSKILIKSGVCGSGKQVTESFSIGDFVPFRRLTLGNSNVTEILSVTDGLGNEYYEVDSLTNDVVYKNVLNTNNNHDVKDNLKIIPAPYRFTKQVNLSTRNVTLVFGGGTADNLEDDIIPDPSEFSIPMPFSKTFSRVPVNPQKMLQTSTLGVAGINTTLSVTYRYGGGLYHNVGPGSIKNINSITMFFPENPSAFLQNQIRSSLEITNPASAAGGEDSPSEQDLLSFVTSSRNSQERIVTKEDLLARIYTMPSNFGRVFRASIVKNPTNPLASRLYIISRNKENQLITSPDALKINLKKYLNAYRMISDAIDIMDAQVINIEINFDVVVDPSLNKNLILQSILVDLKKQFEITKQQIGQPIIISDILSTIYSKKGVIAVDNLKISNINGIVKNREYSSASFDVDINTKNQIIYPPEGSIFEIKYPEYNIVGRCISSKVLK